MKNVLLMGGTNFAGKYLIRHLLNQNCHVTIATRGQAEDSFGAAIHRIKFDRTNLDSMQNAFADKQYDVVFDQIGYCAASLADACRVFAGRTSKYVFTSSNAVYHDMNKRGIVETDLDPLQVEYRPGRYPDEVNYHAGKQQAEAYLANNAPFPFASARIPIVLGVEDPLKRVDFLVRRILEHQPILISPDCGLVSFIEVDDVGRFLAWLGLSGVTGVYNGGSERCIDPLEMTNFMGRILGVEPITVTEGSADDRPDYASPGDKSMDVSKARQDGFEFTAFDQWFPRVVKETAKLYDT